MINIQTIQNLLEAKGHILQSQSLDENLIIFTHLKDKESDQFAIKVFDVDDGSKNNSSQEKVKECQNEVNTIKTLNHKNLVKYHSDYQIGLFYFIQMQKCQSNLDIWSQKILRVIQNQLFYSIAVQILDGLEYLHSNGYILRDLKPQNILIKQKGEKIKIKLSYFGAVKDQPQLTNTKPANYYGSLAYTPPEILTQLLEKKIQVIQTKQGDIWAYGICLSTMGRSQLNFLDYCQKDWQVPVSLLLTAKAQQFINFILVQNPQKRPTLQQIRRKLDTLFKDEADRVQQNKKFKPNVIVPILSQNQTFNNSITYQQQQQNINRNQSGSTECLSKQTSSLTCEVLQYLFKDSCDQLVLEKYNFPGINRQIWLIFLTNFIYQIILMTSYAIYTNSQNVDLMILLGANCTLNMMSLLLVKYKCIPKSWFLLISQFTALTNFAVNEEDPLFFKVSLVVYQIFLTIQLLYFIKILQNNYEQRFCYLIIIYPIFFYLEYSQIQIKTTLIVIFMYLQQIVSLHLWLISSKTHLQGAYIVKSFLNFFVVIFVFSTYGLGLQKPEDFCAAFILNTLTIFLCSILQLKVQVKNEVQNSYKFQARMVFLLNCMLLYISSQDINGTIKAICFIKIIESLIQFLSYVFLFYIQENLTRNKVRLYLEIFFAIILVIQDSIGILSSYQASLNEAIVMFTTLLQLEVILIVYNMFWLFKKCDKTEKDLDSIYIQG